MIKLYGRRGLGCAKGGFAQEKGFAGAASVQGGFVCKGAHHSINHMCYETSCIGLEGLKQC